MSKSEDDSHWRRALTEVSSPRHVRAAGTAEEENKDPFSEFYRPSQKWNCAGSAKSFEEMERCCCRCISRVLSVFWFCFFFFLGTSRGLQNIVLQLFAGKRPFTSAPQVSQSL